MAYTGLRIWFLTGSQDLYGDETLRQVAEQSATIVAGLQASSDIPIEIVHKPLVKEPDGIRRACLDASADERLAPTRALLSAVLAQRALLEQMIGTLERVVWAETVTPPPA